MAEPDWPSFGRNVQVSEAKDLDNGAWAAIAPERKIDQWATNGRPVRAQWAGDVSVDDLELTIVSSESLIS